MRMECLSTGKFTHIISYTKRLAPKTRCFSFVSTNWDQFKDKYRIALR